MTEFDRTENLLSGMAPGGAVAASMLRGAEAWTSAQCELVSGLGAIWTDWLRRRCEAIDASARSLQQMLECRNPADFAQIQQHWLADAARREASDIGALACDVAALSWRAAGADRNVPRRQAAPVRATERSKSGEELQRAAAE